MARGDAGGKWRAIASFRVLAGPGLLEVSSSRAPTPSVLLVKSPRDEVAPDLTAVRPGLGDIRGLIVRGGRILAQSEFLRGVSCRRRLCVDLTNVGRCLPESEDEAAAACG